MEKRKSQSVQVLIVALIVSIISAAPHNSSTFDGSYRLPKSVIPQSYELSLETAVHRNGVTNFGGNVKIKVEIAEETFEIKLHNRGLTIETVKLTNFEGSELPSTSGHDEVREFLIITSTNALRRNQVYFLEISFNGRLKTSGPSGFYRSQYKMANETDPRYLAATQFKPTSAREAFPCFDEPEYRATFILTITHGSNYHALSNTEGDKVNIDNGMSRTTFKETPKMQTYLLAFVVSDLAKFTLSLPGITHNAFARTEHINKGYAAAGLIFTKNFLEIMEEKFSFKFDEKIGKMDSVALPEHESGIENWGMILYKEQYLILEDKPHPYEIYEAVETIAHEIAHQFFSNVVTCKWWDQVWLNEGFASWLEFQLPQMFETTKNLRVYELWNIRKTQAALYSDSLESTRPMTYDANTPSEIMDRLNIITYDKAGAVLKMFQYAIGDDLFTSGIKEYLIKNQYSSATSDDLLSAIESVLPAPFDFEVKRAFRTWELNKGYPIVTATFDNNNKQFLVTQKRYLSVSENRPETDTTSWYIPLSYTTGVNPNFNERKFTDYFVDGQAQKTISTANIPQFDGSQWFIFNIQQLGFYRVNYDQTNWNKIFQVLNSDNYQQIHVLNRAQLVDDALTFAFDGVISYDIAFGLVSYLKRETDYIPWYAASVAFEKLDHILKGTDFHADFHKFVQLLIHPLYIKYDFKNVESLSNSEQMAVELAVEWTCRTGNQACLATAYKHLQSESMPKPLEVAYICNGMRGQNRTEDYEYLWNRLHESISQTERLRIINGLVCTSDSLVLNRFIHNPVVGSMYYGLREVQNILGSVVQKSSVGLELLAGLIDEHYDDIIGRTNEGYIDTLLSDASKLIVTTKDEKLIADLLAELNTQGKEVKQATKDTIAKNIKFNKEWASSSMSTSASVYLHNAIKAIDDFEHVWRLPKIAKPVHYEIHLDASNIHTGALPYTGEVKIDVTILQPTDKILLHSRDHVINEMKVFHKISNTEIRVTNFNQNTEVYTLAIYFAEVIEANAAIVIHIKFSANLLDEIDGFYRDSYIEFDASNNPVTKYLATTQFQAVEARRAFPCFDEPEFRTAFDVSIRHHSSYNAVSNMPANRTEAQNDNTTVTIFNPTPPMSTYLLAFLVSDFKYLSNGPTITEGQTFQRVFTRPGKESRAKYGLENSVKLLEELEKFAGIKFDLPKIDSGAVPGKGGGMENWGLILYREAALIYDDDDEDIGHDARQRGIRLIAHEIAHMFFGDLVTAEWWNYLWLNEGFATYVMYVLTDKLYPDWHMKEFYQRNILLAYAFPTDASDHTRSMSSELITIDDINDSFDDIAYDKASNIIRMFHYTLGDEIFKEAITLYLNENKYGSVTSQHLINAIQRTLDAQSTPFNFERIFRTWEMQEGFPVINVEYRNTTKHFRLTQERFFDNKSRNINDNSRFYIPLNYGTASNIIFEDTAITHYFPDDYAEYYITDDVFNDNEWYIFNKQQIGYYRVNYDEKNWMALTEALNSNNFEKIHINNRVQIIDDAFALAVAGYIDLKIPFEIIMYLRREVNFFAWDNGMDHMFDLMDVFGTRNEELKTFLFHLSKHFYNHFELSNKDSIPKEIMPERYGRSLAITVACSSGNQDCIRDVLVFGAKDVKDQQRVPADLEQPILCNYFRHTESKDEFTNIYNRIKRIYEPMHSRYKSNLISALGCTKNKDFLFEFLEASIGMHSANFTLSERRAIFNAVLRNENGISAAFQLIENNPGSALTDSYGWSWLRILKNIAGSVYTDTERYIFMERIENLNNPGLLREDINEAIESAGENLKNQELEVNSKQIEIIVELLKREFEVTTSSTTTTTTSSTTSDPTTPTRAITTSPVPQSTTPSNAVSITINFATILLSFAIGVFLSN